MKTYTKEDIKKLNINLSVPSFLVKIGANEKSVRKLNTREEYRVNAFYRGGDNPNGIGIRFNTNTSKWLVTDFTQKVFSNIDIIEFATKYCNVGFQRVLSYMEECNNGNINFSKVKDVQTGVYEPKVIDENILNVFNKGLHPYLAGRGFIPQVAKYFGLGWSLVGEMEGRITIPIHNPEGKLVSVQGRDYTGEKPNKYKFLDGTGEDAKNTLYNAHRAIIEAKKRGWVLVVEGCPCVWYMAQNGLLNVVATMSTSVTENQLKQLKEMGLKVVLWFDYDENQAGQYGALKTLKSMKKMNFKNVYLVNTGFVCSPDDLTKEEIAYQLKHIKKIL